MRRNARGTRKTVLKKKNALQRAKRQKRSTPSQEHKRRIHWLSILLLACFMVLGGRMVHLQMKGRIDSEPTREGMFAQRRVLVAPRGQILAADGTALAVTAHQYDIAVNPRAVSEKEKMATIFVQTLGGSREKYLEDLNKVTRANGEKNYYVRVARGVEEERVEKLRALMLPPKDGKESRSQRTERKEFWAPVSLEPTPRRQYPLGNFASQLIGFTTTAGKGVEGLERAWEKELAGRDGEIIAQVDARKRPIPGFVREQVKPVPGQNVVTTIDPVIQAAAQATMDELVEKFRPNFATAVVMRPKTGEIVAMVTAPSFDLNNRPANVVELATNRNLQFAYEPGSTFKIITAAAAIESVPNWRQHSFVCNGRQLVGKHNMRCWVYSTAKRRHGDVDLSESIRDSCNFGVYGFARLMGADTLLDYTKRFGLEKTVGLARLAEHPGLLPKNDPARWSPEQLANFSFGQGMLMTPLQLVQVMATLANDGIMMKPLLVKELRNEREEVLQRFSPQEVGQIVEPETARLVMKMMERVVKEGTASKYIFVPGYASAGKTGSAQKSDGPRGYAAGRFISSFVGATPAENPEFVTLIMADEPHGSHWGSEVCGPAYAAIAESAMLRLRLQKGAEAPAPDEALMERSKDGSN